MSSPARGCTRLVRLTGLGGSSLLLASGAHLAGGGRMPPMLVLALSGAVVALVAAALTARRCRWRLLAGVLGVEQLALHLVFGATAPVGPGCGPAVTEAGHHAAVAIPGCVPLPGGFGSGMLSDHSAGMWLAHAVAVLATAWLLARGESWLWATADLVVRVATAAPVRRPGTPAAAPLAVRGRTTGDARLPSLASPRGPPVLLGP
jgi:hypothetical protein